VTFGAGLVAALGLTLLVEVPVAFAAGWRGRRELLAVVLVNLITNPLLNITLVAVWVPAGAARMPLLVALEIVAIVIEWRLLLPVIGRPSRRVLVVVIVMNAASVALGLLLTLV
jgi:hypothetical protein